MVKLKKNNLLEKIKNLSKDGDFFDYDVKDSNELNMVIAELKDLENYDLTDCHKNIELKIFNLLDKNLLINNVISGNIPDNFSRIIIQDIIILHDIRGLIFNGELKFYNVLLSKFRLKNSEIKYLEFQNINKKLNNIGFGIWDNNKIDKLVITNGKNFDEIKIKGIEHSPNNIKEIILSNLKVDNIEIGDNFSKNINISSSNIDRLLLEEKDLNILDINGNNINECIVMNSSGLEFNFKDNSVLNFKLYNLYFNNINFINFKYRKLLFKEYLSADESYYDGIFIPKEIEKDDEEYLSIEIVYGKDIYGNKFYIDKNYDANYLFKKIKNIDKIKFIGINNELSELFKVSLKFENIRFKKSENSYYYIAGLGLNKLEFKNCLNLSDFFEMNYLYINNFYINDFNLGEAIINNVTIKSKFYLNSPVFNNTILNGVEFPIDYRLEEGELSNKQLKDLYRQLKHVMDKNSNYTEANKFYELEMEYYMNEIEEKGVFRKGWFKNLRNTLFTGKNAKLVGDKLTLKIGYGVSEFGNNWLKPIFLIIILALLSADIQYLYNSIPDISNNLPKFQIYSNVTVGDIYNIFGKLGTLIISLIIIVYLFSKFPIILIILFGISIQYLSDFPIIDNFAKFLYPLYGFKKDFIDSLGFLEIIGLVLHKTIYGILLWHLIIAVKRNTKR